MGIAFLEDPHAPRTVQRFEIILFQRVEDHAIQRLFHIVAEIYGQQAPSAPIVEWLAFTKEQREADCGGDLAELDASRVACLSG